MSIILKEIDPKTDYGLCILTIRGELITANGKHIQAIQIPRGHGRIGDLDELQKAIRTDIMGGLNYEYFIRNAPTILEEE